MNNIDKIKYLCSIYGIDNYTINKDLSIDVDGHVDISDRNLNKIPLKFRNVDGYFDCSNNKLTSLENCPLYIGSNFYCTNNNLFTLEGMANYIGGEIYLYYNNISNFKGFPEDYYGVVHYGFNNVANILSLFYPIAISKISKVINLINEYDVIKNNNIILDRLEEVFIELNLKFPDILKMEGYIIDHYNII